MINVTEPFLPPIEEFNLYLDNIWASKWLTNNGPFLNELELKLKRYFDLKHLLFLGNGTIALQIAIKALELEGDIVTTPFSYVATTSSIVWENCKPVFVDIDIDSFNIDSSKIEAAITNKTSAILATHVFGNPCNIQEINRIAKKHNLKVIYDAAHCFGVKYQDKSIFEYGDVSTLSTHATKVFHTIEGGVVVTNSAKLLKKMSVMRNFGHDGPNTFSDIGINGKNSEFHAAMGLANLKYIDLILEKRKKQFLFYKEKLSKLKVSYQTINSDTAYNYSYFPIVFDSEANLELNLKELNRYKIFPRRYFYPSLSKLPYVEQGEIMEKSELLAKRILCLPLYHNLNGSIQKMICRILLRTQNYM